MVNLDPAHGDTEQLRAAARRIREYAQALIATRTTASSQATITSDGTWTGLGSDALATTLTGLATSSVGIVDGWDRFANAVDSCATRLDGLKEEARIAVANYRTCHADVKSAQRTVDNAEDDNPGVTGIYGSLNDAKQAQATAEAVLDEIQNRRDSLYNEIVHMILNAPGPGATAWHALSTGPSGRRLSTQQLIDNVTALFTDGTVTEDDLAILQQFMLENGSDPALCDTFYSQLGPQGLADLEAAVVSTAALAGEDVRKRGSDLISLLNNGLAIASQQWSPATAQHYGSDLIDAIEDAQSATAVLVPGILSASGLNPNLGLGAINRLDQIRVEDPQRFEQIGTEHGTGAFTGDAGLAAALLGTTQVHDLATATFGLLERLPKESLAYFGNARTPESKDRIDYWFYERDWSQTGFEAPTGLLDAMTNAPALQDGRWSPDANTDWANLTAFASRALSGLGANPQYTITTITPTAAHNIAGALTPYTPEIAALAEGGNSGRASSHVLSENGHLVTRTLDMNRGNLARLIGIASADERALATFGNAATDWRNAVINQLNAGTLPADRTQMALASIGAMQGLLASYGAEVAKHADTISDQRRKALDVIFSVISLIPSASTGTVAADYLISVTTGQVQGVITDLDLSILTDDQISRLSTEPRVVGKESLTTSLEDSISLSPQQEQHLEQSASEVLGNQYDTTSNACTNPDSTGDYNVFKPGEDDKHDTGSARGEMP